MSDDKDDDQAGIDELENVLAFTKPLDKHADIREARNMIRKPGGEVDRRCLHRSVWVNEKYRNCECRRCGAIIEAFDWLLERTKEGDIVEWDLKSVRGEIERRRENLEKLKQAELNTKGRIKTAQFKLNDLETAIWKIEQKMNEGKA
ncbi:hypothetical protein [Citrobacter werkmanii]|uniref:hypothetical protein n=1 Tax=Citrobacter werkmanii TaxID=67827 RepID=UPI0037C925DB